MGWDFWRTSSEIRIIQTYFTKQDVPRYILFPSTAHPRYSIFILFIPPRPRLVSQERGHFPPKLRLENFLSVSDDQPRIEKCTAQQVFPGAQLCECTEKKGVHSLSVHTEPSFLSRSFVETSERVFVDVILYNSVRVVCCFSTIETIAPTYQSSNRRCH